MNKLTFLLFSAVVTLMPSMVIAQANPAGQLQEFATDGGYAEAATPTAYLGNLLGVVYGLLGVIVLIFFVYAGAIWLLARGNASEISRAKAIMTNTGIAAAILLGAFAITAFALSVLAGA